MHRQHSLLKSFTSCFFREADTAIQEYVAWLLSDAAHDGSSAGEVCQALEGFMSSSDVAAANGGLEGAVAELLSALRDPCASQAAPSWEAKARCMASEAGPAADPLVAKPGLSTLASASKLSAAAATFQPAGAASSVAPVASEPEGEHPAKEPTDGAAAQLAGLSLSEAQHLSSGAAGIPTEWHAGATGVWECPVATPLGSQLQDVLQGSSAEMGAFLSVLAQQFPEYSDAVLRELLEEQGGSLEATVDMLFSLEWELQGQAAVTTTHQHQQAVEPRPLAASEFPALSGTVAPPVTHASLAAPGPGAYAAALGKRGGTAGTICGPAGATPSAAAGRRATKSAAGILGAAVPAKARASHAKSPIWEAQGVPRFATGAQNAAEYAAAREAARDHARLRNAYFQQATLAYLAGQRALAKELGEKGRWHGQQMQAAHREAAEGIFATRNPGTATGGGPSAPAAAPPGRSPSSSSSPGGVPTVDLHGLHVAEALEKLESVLLGLAPPAGVRGVVSRGGRGQGGKLRVVVGVGQHGKVPARLPAAVRRYLQGQGLQVSEPYAGLLEVGLP
ncbi:hypothetical protein N2152v2_003955 [Parachlorella kessleri]